MKFVSGIFRIRAMQCISRASILLIMISCLSSKPVTPSQWKTDFSNVEPTLNEGYMTFPDTRIIVKTYNSSDALCIYIRFLDNQDQHKVLMNGLSIWIDVTAGKKENFGVIFSPTYLSAAESMPENKMVGLDISAMVQKLNLSVVQIKKGDDETLMDTRYFIVTYDKQHNLNYKITVPFSQLGITNTPGKSVSIGIFSDNSKARNVQNHDRNKENSEGDELGEHNSEMHGNMNGGPHSEGQSREENTELNENSMSRLKSWIKIMIATGPY